MISRQVYLSISILVASIIFINLNANAQLVDRGYPISWKEKLDKYKNTGIISMPGFDLNQMLYEDSINNQMKNQPWRFGFNHEVDLSPNNAGSWFELPNGDRVWQLHIKSPGAKSINIIFDEFFIPQGAHMHMFSFDRSHLVGAYTSILNNTAQVLGTEIVKGDHVIIEYYEPKSVKGALKLQIGTVTHAYRDLSYELKNHLKDLNDSGECNIDVNCPLGDGWQDQINSVGLIIANGNTWCSGALINNTLQDGRPLFLTANHCLGNPSNWVFRFNWDSPNPSCATTTPSSDGPFNQTVFTGTLLSSSANSDFALVEINNSIPADWEVFYAGWDRTDIAPEFTIGIHHPSGDIKKICKDEDAPYHAQSGEAEVWWIDEWEEGVTEGGSSGSPLFDSNGRIIGQLFGGLAACSINPTTENNGLYDFYGRFATSWDGSSAGSRLKDHLDPLGLEPMILDGYDPQGPGFDIDVALINTGELDTPVCDSLVSLSPCVRNLGNESINSLIFDIQSNGEIIFSYNWSGSLESGEVLCLDLPEFSLPEGLNSLTMSVHSPNGGPDDNPDNNTRSLEVFMIHDGSEVVLTIELDCWGSETSWLVENEQGDVMAAGGPYQDNSNGESIQENICLPEGCFTFTILDSFGDGLHGSQYSTCTIDGNYFMTNSEGDLLFQMDAPNGDFGSSATHEFCLESEEVVADFESDAVAFCPGTSVQFFDLSSGTDVISWEWSFEGGSPQSSDLQNPTVIYNLPGVYSVTLTVNDGNSSSTETKEGYITVHESPEVTVALIEDFECGDECTGSLLATVTEGESPYTVNWSNGMEGSQITGVCFNPEFTVTVTDANGCQSTNFINVDLENQWFIDWAVAYDCNDLSSCVLIDIEGSAPEPLLITWDDGGTMVFERCDLEPGSYTVTVQDSDGCANSAIISIDSIYPLELSIDSANESCENACDGFAELDISAATPYSVEWLQLESMAESVDGLCAGQYDVVITDAYGCVLDTTVVIDSGDPLDVDGVFGSTHCNAETACVELEVNGGVGDYAYAWSDGSDQDSINCDYSAGEHSVTVTDVSGCQAVFEFNIEFIQNPQIDSKVTHESCLGDCDGSILLEVNGFGSITYDWSDNDHQGAEIDSLCAGTYMVTITDGNGCESFFDDEILMGDTPPIAAFEASDTIYFISSSSPLSFINLSENADRYEWDFGDGNTSEEVEPSHIYDSIGTFNVVLTAFNGRCSASFSVNILVELESSTTGESHFGQIDIYPNPTSEFIYLDFDHPISSKTTFQLFNSSGKLIDVHIEYEGGQRVEIPVNSHPSGLYYLTIFDDQYRIIRKVAILR